MLSQRAVIQSSSTAATVPAAPARRKTRRSSLRKPLFLLHITHDADHPQSNDAAPMNPSDTASIRRASALLPMEPLSSVGRFSSHRRNALGDDRLPMWQTATARSLSTLIVPPVTTFPTCSMASAGTGALRCWSLANYSSASFDRGVPEPVSIPLTDRLAPSSRPPIDGPIAVWRPAQT